MGSCFSQHSQNYSPFPNRSFGVVNMSGTRGSTNQQRKGKQVAAPVWRPVSTQPEQDCRTDVSKKKGDSSSSHRTEGGAAEAHASGEKHSVSIEIVKSPSLDYSHFISLPLAIHPELVEKLENFQNSILGCSTSSHDELGIDRSIFINPKTFHLTVLMLKLWNKDRVAAATEVLQKISSKVNAALDNRPVFISLKGLECMRGSAAKAWVVYAPIEEIGGEGRLLQACQVIIQSYVEAGLVLEKDARQALKLHATLMNAKHRKSKKRTKRVDGFDARGIFLRYGSENWGEYLIKEAHLSKRFMYEESGYYHCCASIPFPGQPRNVARANARTVLTRGGGLAGRGAARGRGRGRAAVLRRERAQPRA